MVEENEMSKEMSKAFHMTKTTYFERSFPLKFYTNLARSIAKSVNSRLKDLVFSSSIMNLLEIARFAKDINQIISLLTRLEWKLQSPSNRISAQFK